MKILFLVLIVILVPIFVWQMVLFVRDLVKFIKAKKLKKQLKKSSDESDRKE